MALKAASIMAKKPKVLNPLPIRNEKKNGKSLQKSFFVLLTNGIGFRAAFVFVGRKEDG